MLTHNIYSFFPGYKQLKISLPCSYLQEILAAREFFAGNLPKEFLLNGCKNAVVDAVLRKLFPRQLSEERVVGKRESKQGGFSTTVLMPNLRLKFFTFKDKEEPV